MLPSKIKSVSSGPEILDLQTLRGSSNEIIIQVDSKTKIEVQFQDSEARIRSICTVVKKSNPTFVTSVSEQAFKQQKPQTQRSNEKMFMLNGRDSRYLDRHQNRGSQLESLPVNNTISSEKDKYPCEMLRRSPKKFSFDKQKRDPCDFLKKYSSSKSYLGKHTKYVDESGRESRGTRFIYETLAKDMHKSSHSARDYARKSVHKADRQSAISHDHLKNRPKGQNNEIATSRYTVDSNNRSLSKGLSKDVQETPSYSYLAKEDLLMENLRRCSMDENMSKNDGEIVSKRHSGKASFRKPSTMSHVSTPAPDVHGISTMSTSKSNTIPVTPISVHPSISNQSIDDHQNTIKLTSLTGHLNLPTEENQDSEVNSFPPYSNSQNMKNSTKSIDISPNEEVWVVSAPKSLSMRNMVGAKLKVGARSSTKINNEDNVNVKFVIQEYPDNRFIQVVSNNGNVQEIETAGSIQITTDKKSREM